MTITIKYLTSITLLVLVGTILPASADLFIGSDTEEFGQSPLPDKIGKYQTNGPLIVGGGNIPLAVDDFANGMTIVGGNLLTGTVAISDLTLRDLNAVPVAAPFDADTPDRAFNEDLAFDGTSVWRAHCSGQITELDPNNLGGPALSVDRQPFCAVGMTFANGQLWLTDWGARLVGTYDPVNDVFDPVFQTPTRAGCLAWDSQSQILWVGLQGGNVIPYNLNGVQQGPAFQPFGRISATIDGCAFSEEGIEIDIKPASDPNSINTKSKGTIPVAILSTPDFDATEVDKDSLTFGKTGDENSLKKCTKSNEDVNGDGLLDVVCHFNTQDTGFQVGDTEGILKGQLLDGTPIEGRDSVRIVK